MRFFRNSILLATGGMLALTMPVFAQQAGTNPSKSATSANQRAADLINTVNKGEIDTAKMMQDHSQNDQVKDFAKSLETDHQDAQNKLEAVAGQSNISLREMPAMRKQDNTLKQKLQSDSPTAADKAYLAAEVKDHSSAIRRLKSMEPNVTDPALKSYIDSTLPVLQKHLDEAKKLQGQLGGGSGE